jgi:hypothetical protein
MRGRSMRARQGRTGFTEDTVESSPALEDCDWFGGRLGLVLVAYDKK